MKQILIQRKGETDNNIIIVYDFNIPLASMGKSSGQKINKEILALNGILYQMNLIDIYRTFHPQRVEYTFFSSAHGTTSRIDYMLGHKVNVNKFKIICIFFNFCDSKLEMNTRKKGKTQNVESKQHASK